MALHIVAEETVPTSAEMLTLPAALLLTEEPIVPAVFATHREEVPVDEFLDPEEQPMLVDQRQTAEARVEEQTTSEEPAMHTTQEAVPEPIVSIEAEPARPAEPSFSKTVVQVSSLPSGEYSLKKDQNEMVLPKNLL